MQPPTERSATPEAAFGRCRCGHVAGDHIRVVPIGDHSGGFRLEPSGPCARCGRDVCSRMTRPG